MCNALDATSRLEPGQCGVEPIHTHIATTTSCRLALPSHFGKLAPACARCEPAAPTLRALICRAPRQSWRAAGTPPLATQRSWSSCHVYIHSARWARRASRPHFVAGRQQAAPAPARPRPRRGPGRHTPKRAIKTASEPLLVAVRPPVHHWYTVAATCVLLAIPPPTTLLPDSPAPARHSHLIRGHRQRCCPPGQHRPPPIALTLIIRNCHTYYTLYCALDRRHAVANRPALGFVWALGLLSLARSVRRMHAPRQGSSALQACLRRGACAPPC